MLELVIVLAFAVVILGALAARGHRAAASHQVNVQHDVTIVRKESRDPQSLVEVLDMVERDAGGDYGKAVNSLHLKGVSADIMLAYDEARRSPTAETWRRLREVLVADLEALRGGTRA